MPPRTRRLDPAEEQRYLLRACSALHAAHLNAQYPPARAASFQLRCMGPAVHGGLHKALELDLRSGLPTYREWMRVLTDRGVAEGALAALPDEAALAERAARAPAGIHGKRWLKAGYYRTLLQHPLLDTDRVSVTLRRVDARARTAYFTVVLDKLDAGGCLVRYSVELHQQSALWRRPLLELDQDSVRQTEEFQSLVYRFASIDAELTFARLAEHDLVGVERVTRGCIGPFFTPGVHAPAELGPLLAAPDAWLATFSLDLAAVELAADCNNDPLGRLIADRLSARARAEYEQARARFRYKVFKDRKFVASAGLVDGVRALCARLGTRNIVYPMDEEARPQPGEVV